MHKLSRQVRFSITPFLADQTGGHNSFASKPCGEGLAMFLELGLSVIGEADAQTGFVVNVTDIDAAVREHFVPVLADGVQKAYDKGEHVSMQRLIDLLWKGVDALRGTFGTILIGEANLKLNPYRSVSVDCEDRKMVYFSEKFDFAAMHKLWNDDFSEEQNFQVFGKCANPTGHGHNYIIEVTVKSGDAQALKVGKFENIVDQELMQLIDHKNLNVDVEGMKDVIPTIENIAVFAWDRLDGKFEELKLHSVTVWETDKTYCTYYG